jgi:hypothetical protein
MIIFNNVTILRQHNSVFGMCINLRILCINCNIVLRCPDKYGTIYAPPIQDILVDGRKNGFCVNKNKKRKRKKKGCV